MSRPNLGQNLRARHHFWEIFRASGLAELKDLSPGEDATVDATRGVARPGGPALRPSLPMSGQAG